MTWGARVPWHQQARVIRWQAGPEGCCRPACPELCGWDGQPFLGYLEGRRPSLDPETHLT